MGLVLERCLHDEMFEFVQGPVQCFAEVNNLPFDFFFFSNCNLSIYLLIANGPQQLCQLKPQTYFVWHVYVTLFVFLPF